MPRPLLLLTICVFLLFTSVPQLNERHTTPLIHHRQVDVCAGTSPLYITIHKELSEKVTELKIDVAKTIVNEMSLAGVRNFNLIWVAEDSRSEWEGPLNHTETMDLLTKGTNSTTTKDQMVSYCDLRIWQPKNGTAEYRPLHLLLTSGMRLRMGFCCDEANFHDQLCTYNSPKDMQPRFHFLRVGHLLRFVVTFTAVKEREMVHQELLVDVLISPMQKRSSFPSRSEWNLMGKFRET